MDDQTPFKMPPFTGRNVLIFSDGNGQAGGLVPDEARSNVYKLYCATRCGSDTKIDPDRQLAFYAELEAGAIQRELLRQGAYLSPAIETALQPAPAAE